ncbi:hypothetical protein [Streptomyces sp. V2I9]|uniref:hypothetical protein n=1 Tax=Streptomyces sp. V2I9 TaxID=3042304 RepID=UPI0027809175|nr:hypothetical protein [Streptomyces sp. V2I9]MDQ0984362.1 hypothetical protein [Streptomyces sp. V2I9]
MDAEAAVADEHVRWSVYRRVVPVTASSPHRDRAGGGGPRPRRAGGDPPPERP